MDSPLDVVISRARVLASPVRVNLWNRLGQEGEHPIVLAREFALAPATVTYHLRVLRDAGLVEVVGAGAARVYRWTSERLVLASRAELAAVFGDAINNV